MRLFSKMSRLSQEPKTVIGWAHGVLAIVGAFGLAYLCGTSLSALLRGDMAERIFPSMFLFPLLVCGFGFWLLFSKNLLHVTLKIVLMALLNACIIAFV
jgi:hypothetical protein